MKAELTELFKDKKFVERCCLETWPGLFRRTPEYRDFIIEDASRFASTILGNLPEEEVKPEPQVTAPYISDFNPFTHCHQCKKRYWWIPFPDTSGEYCQCGDNPDFSKYLPTYKPIKYPHTCPVCNGTQQVPDGFYLYPFGQTISSSTAPEPCRTCEGSGIVWG